jgi:branched-chain amino acid aminotransferase
MNNEIVFLNGLFIPLKNARVSILDRGFAYGDSLFETMRAYQGDIFQLEAHLSRLLSSLEQVMIDLPLTRGELQSALQNTLEYNQLDDSIIRLMVTRGEQEPGLLSHANTCPTLVIHARPYKPPPEHWFRDGIRVSLFPNSAVRTSTLGQQVKSSNYLSHILIRELAEKQNSVEGILLDDNGNVTEGTVSNLFMVKDGQLSTPALNQHILSGITRQVVLDIAGKNDIPTAERVITAQELRLADEIFLTNSGVEILPVSHVDGIKVGRWQAREVTRNLQNAFRKTVEAELQR